MDRGKIEDALIEIGIPAGVKGFNHIADAVEYIDKCKGNINVTKSLHPEIAEKRNTTPSSVERSIRYAFEIARGQKENHEIVKSYIGLTNCSNLNSLMRLYKKIKREPEGTNSVRETKEERTESNNAITALEIREIFRQELRMALNELKGDAI